MAALHQPGQIDLAERPMDRDPSRQSSSQIETLPGLPAGPGTGQMQMDRLAAEAGEHPQQPVNPLGMAQLAGIEQLHRPGCRFVAEGEHPVIESGPDDLDFLSVHPIKTCDLLRLTRTQRQDRIDSAAIIQHPAPEMGALHKLPQIRRMAGHNQRQTGKNAPGHGACPARGGDCGRYRSGNHAAAPITAANARS